MAYRDSVVINVSYYYAFHKLPQALHKPHAKHVSPHDQPSNPAFVAASLVNTILDFRASLLQGKIEPDTMGGTKLDMESYKWSVCFMSRTC
jgi:carnitine O-acetyltransferase